MNVLYYQPTDNNSVKTKNIGIITGVMAGISFGLIPLFSIPVINAGIGDTTILLYRFLFGCLGMLVALLYRRIDLRLSKGDVARVSILSLFYIGTAMTTLESYKYLSSGVATALVYTDPIWCSLIGITFLHEAFSKRITSAVVLATLGVMMLTGVFTEDIRFSAIGVTWGLLSGLSYALYLIFIPRLRIGKMPSLKLTFYVFCIALIMLTAWDIIAEGGIQTPKTAVCWMDLILLGLIPTAFSNICVTMSLKMIDSTIVAILGAFEPVTAMIIGILVLGDPFSFFSICGTVLILFAVSILTVLPKLKAKYFRSL